MTCDKSNDEGDREPFGEGDEAEDGVEGDAVEFVENVTCRPKVEGGGEGKDETEFADEC